MSSLSRVLLTLSVLINPLSLAHSGHGAPEVAANADWATRHMAEEHHISSFDAGSFFTLHDFSSRGYWDSDDILKTYGLRDPSTAHITQDQRDEVVRRVLGLFDRDQDGRITADEFTERWRTGRQLPDFGHGPGHHGDDEYEYEIHHFEKYHDENTKLEDLTHPEDIAHFKHHEEMERLQEELDRREKLGSVDEKNIPSKFRRQG